MKNHLISLVIPNKEYEKAEEKLIAYYREFYKNILKISDKYLEDDMDYLQTAIDYFLREIGVSIIKVDTYNDLGTIQWNKNEIEEKN